MTRINFRQRRRWAPMLPALAVRNYFDELPTAGIGDYRVWDDACVAV